VGRFIKSTKEHLCAKKASLHVDSQMASAGSYCTYSNVTSCSKNMGSVLIPLGVPSNMLFHIPHIISHPSLWITLQFPIFGNHTTHYDKQWFWLFTRQITEQSVLCICMYLLRMSPSYGCNLFCAQSHNTAITLYNKHSDICNTSDAGHHAHSHQKFHVLSHSHCRNCSVLLPFLCQQQTTHVNMLFVSVMDSTII